MARVAKSAPPAVQAVPAVPAAPAVPAVTGRDEGVPVGGNADLETAEEGPLLMDRYRLGTLVNEGRRALIYQAEDVRLQRLVVVKRLRPEVFTIAGFATVNASRGREVCRGARRVTW